MPGSRRIHPLDDGWPSIQSTFDQDVGNVAQAAFLLAATVRGHRAEEVRQWSTHEQSLDSLRAPEWRILFESQDGNHGQMVLETDGCIVYISLKSPLAASEQIKLRVSGPNIRSVRDVLDRFAIAFPTETATDDNTIAVRFWTGGNYGPNDTLRRLATPTWADIARNYPTPTRRDLDPAMHDLELIAARGRILLWHGPPGTGKTFAVRALARQHVAVAATDYILEPEVFFGKGAHQLTDLLQENSDSEPRKWRLLVVEDCDELISIDAKERAGQGMARLLNLSDGLFGQAFNVVILITTNEPMTSFHPAIARPGRCGSLVGFERFGEVEARQWLGLSPDDDTSIAGRLTLAELFAQRDGYQARPSPPGVGFRSRRPLG